MTGVQTCALPIFGVAIWSEVGTEWMAEVEQALGGSFSLRGGVSYSWDELWDETVWRPFASLSFERGGWHAVLNWSRNEYIQEQKDLRDDYKGRLERRPEVEVRSPWFRISPESWVSLSASWGSYREETAALRSDVIYSLVDRLLTICCVATSLEAH